MLIDHIAWCFVDTYSVLGLIMHTIGRLTAPIMCYFLAEGFHYTRSIKKYLGRLGIFTIVSWLPYFYMEFGSLPVSFDGGDLIIYPYQSMIYTLFLALLALTVIHSDRLPRVLKAFTVTFLTMLSIIGDWPVCTVVWVYLFDKYRGDFKKQAAAFIISDIPLILLLMWLAGGPITDNLFQFGVILAVIPLYFYNGERGNGGAWSKWIFYIFYPLHMLVLGLIEFGL